MDKPAMEAFPLADVLTVVTGMVCNGKNPRGYRGVYGCLLGREIFDHEIILWHALCAAFLRAQLPFLEQHLPPPSFQNAPRGEQRDAVISAWVDGVAESIGTTHIAVRPITPKPTMEPPHESFLELLADYRAGRR